MKSKKFHMAIAKTIIATLMVSNVVPTIQVFARTSDNQIVVQTVTQKRNVMYYSDWSIWGGQENFYPKDIPADQLTHLNFAFLDFDGEGNLVFTDKDAAVGAPVGQTGVQWDAPNAGILNALQELRAKNPNLKLGVSIGGWSRSGDFTEVTSHPEKRAKFIENIVKFLEYTNMDYVDIDWEYPNFVREGDLVDLAGDEGTPNAVPEDKENYALLLEEMRVALDQKGAELGKTYELSIALPVGKEKIDLGLAVDRIFNAIDFANIMSYDMRGGWDDLSGHQTPLYANPGDTINTESGRLLSIDQTVDYLIKLGAAPEKLVIGAAHYTRGWDQVEKGDNEELPGLFQTAYQTGKDADQTATYGAENELPLKVGDGGRAGGVWAYRSLDKLKAKYPNLQEYWDDIAKAPYLYDETTGRFFTYDNVQSINEKGSYVNEHQLGGIIGWQAANDKPVNGTSVRGELTTATKQALFGDEDLQEHEVVYAKLDIEATITPYEIAWGTDRSGYEITIKNHERAEESDAVLKAVERGAETIKAPKLYIKTATPLNRGDHMAGTVTYEDGYTVVDLKSVWEGKNIEQGQSYTFKLTGDAVIESIEIVQRMSDNSPELARQTILGEVGETVNKAPVLIGVTNKTITVGEDFDPLEGVTATDKEDGDLTSSIHVAGSVNTMREGAYELIYSVVDSQGLETISQRTITVKQEVVLPPVEEESDFGVGQGIEWPAQVNAPYADMTLWNNGEFSVNGALNLKKIAEDTGVRFFNLGFIQATGGVSDQKVNWGWGGYSVLNENNPDNTQYQGIKQGIKEVRALGGDVAISLGGLNGTAIWQVTQDVEVLYNTYKEIITGYGLTRLDLDIEGAEATNKTINRANAKAIKKVQDEIGVEIVLTLAVLPTGLTPTQLDVLEVYLDEGVQVDLVNIMTMCYGSATLLPGENYGTASLRAVDSTKEQLQTYFKQYANQTLSDAEAYSKIGTTVSVGFEGEAHPIFIKEWTALVVEHAIDRGLGMTSMWSINRDSMAQSNQGINKAYEHTDLFKQFGGEEVGPLPNTAPTLSGLVDKSINVGESFDVLEGITAYDKEDGDLTDKIEVIGTVDPMVVGNYTLTYVVTDNEGLTTTQTITVTVKEITAVGDTYDPLHIYYGGEVVSYKGESYKAKWWTQGDIPGTSAVWERLVVPNEDGSMNWYEGMICVGGDQVVYNGKTYQAKWWTTSVPGSDESWEIVG